VTGLPQTAPDDPARDVSIEEEAHPLLVRHPQHLDERIGRLELR
jgi:hypothetical protein